MRFILFSQFQLLLMDNLRYWIVVLVVETAVVIAQRRELTINRVQKRRRESAAHQLVLMPVLLVDEHA